MHNGFSIVLTMLIASLLTATAAQAQYYGHEYEGAPAPIRPGEQSVIPLDTEDPTYNSWRVPRDDLQKGREPGTFDPNRFPLWLELCGGADLPASASGFDPGGSAGGRCRRRDDWRLHRHGHWHARRIGGAERPSATARSYGGYGTDMPHMMTMVDPLKELTVVDYGNAPNDLMSTERTIHAVRSLVREARRGAAPGTGAAFSPVIIGGDHSLMYPDVRRADRCLWRGQCRGGPFRRSLLTPGNTAKGT